MNAIPEIVQPPQPPQPPSPRPRPIAVSLTAYAPPPQDARIRLKLDANEGRPPGASVLNRALAAIQASSNRYSTPRRLEALIAETQGVTAEQVLVTAGGDEAIDRLCRVFLEPGRRMVATTPSFEMIPHYARSAGAMVEAIEWWGGPFPVTGAIAAASGAAVLSVVSPNNPTGAVIAPTDLIALSCALPATLLLVDLAYAEYADLDLTALALSLPNTVVIRTFSKFFGLASLRVGYALGPEPIIRAMRAAAGPFPVSAFSLAAAETCITRPDGSASAAAARVRAERAELSSFLNALGVPSLPTQGNFVLAQFRDARDTHERLLEQGVSVRTFSALNLHDRLRITLPGNENEFRTLLSALEASVSAGRSFIAASPSHRGGTQIDSREGV